MTRDWPALAQGQQSHDLQRAMGEAMADCPKEASVPKGAGTGKKTHYRETENFKDMESGHVS